MANAGQFVLQVSDFTLAGIDKTNRTLRVKGNAIPIIVPGSVNTGTVVAGGSGWVVGDFALRWLMRRGAILKVATVSTGAIATVTVAKRFWWSDHATTADVATAIAPFGWHLFNHHDNGERWLWRPADYYRLLDHIQRGDVQRRQCAYGRRRSDSYRAGL